MSETVLVVAAHPDDEVLGCGGIIATHARAGDEIEIVFLTNGVGARNGAPGEAARNAAALLAAERLGARTPVFHDFPDNRLDGIDLLDVVRVVEAQVARVAPTIVYTHHAGDLNVDHRIAQGGRSDGLPPATRDNRSRDLCLRDAVGDGLCRTVPGTGLHAATVRRCFVGLDHEALRPGRLCRGTAPGAP
jgi:LmbE family N-acetylglucosaminyl deacetylase